jgi:hypothetical protein
MFKFFSRRGIHSWQHTQKYSSLQTDDEHQSSLPELSCDKSTNLFEKLKDTKISRYIIFIYLIFSSGIISFVILESYGTHLSLSASKPSANVKIAPCGNSSTEALAAGCHFDIISFSWLPDECYDAELAFEFKNFNNWAYYLDRNRTWPVSQELALTGGFAGLYTEFEYHLRHCTYMWKKLHRAMLGKGKAAIDSINGQYTNTEHCSHMLLTRRDVNLDVINAVIVVKYPDCGIA